MLTFKLFGNVQIVWSVFIQIGQQSLKNMTSYRWWKSFYLTLTDETQIKFLRYDIIMTIVDWARLLKCFRNYEYVIWDIFSMSGLRLYARIL